MAHPPEEMYIDPQDVLVSMENLFLYTINELEGNLDHLMTDKFGSHTLRILLVILAGENLDRSAHRSLLHSRKKENIAVAHAEQGASVLESRAVPESFVQTLRKMICESIGGLETAYLRALATHPTGNPMLQLLVRLELSKFGKQRAKDEASTIRKLLPDDPITCHTPSYKFINGLMHDAVGSRLVETIVECAPGKMFKALYRELFRDRLGTLARTEIAGYVVAKVLERLGEDDLQDATQLVLPQVADMVGRNRTLVIRTLIARCAARSVDTAPIAAKLETALSGPNGFDITRLLQLSEVGTTGAGQAVSSNGHAASEQPGSDGLHGSLLTQAMLTVDGPLSDLVFNSLARLGTPLTLSMAKSPSASRALQGALTSPVASIIFRRRIIQQFYGHIGEMALDPSASHVVDAAWQGTYDLAFIRERIAKELAANEAALRASFAGRKVWRNWKMDLYKRHRAKWVSQSADKRKKAPAAIDAARTRMLAARQAMNNNKDCKKINRKLRLHRATART